MNLHINSIIDFLRENGYSYEYIGRDDLSVKGFCSLANLKLNSLTWIKSLERFEINTIDPDMQLLIVTTYPENLSDLDSYNIIASENPKAMFFSILTNFFIEKSEPEIFTSSTVLTDNIGENVFIGHNCYICADAAIGNNVIIKNNVSIDCKTAIGENSIIHSGVIIGTDGFGYYQNSDGINKKVPHFGGVKIGKNVEIGANTCVDRGTIDDTIIEDNVKINNLCHIAHNVHIKKNASVLALSMISGSAILEKNSYIAQSASIMNQITIGENSIVGMGAVVTKDVEANKVVAGVPATVLRDNY